MKAAIARESAGDTQEPLWIVLIGHGTSDWREAKFNLRGPDVSDAELADVWAYLKTIPESPPAKSIALLEELR